MFKITFIPMLISIISSVVSGQTTGATDVARIQSEYADVLALKGTAKAELLAIARLLRAKPEMAIDQTKAASEYCFNSGQGTMVHYATQPEATTEDVVYEFDATQLIAAGLDPHRVPELPALGKMESGKWYLLSGGAVDPHHQHRFATPTLVIGVNVK